MQTSQKTRQKAKLASSSCYFGPAIVLRCLQKKVCPLILNIFYVKEVKFFYGTYNDEFDGKFPTKRY